MAGPWKTCPHCGFPLPQEASFCPHCTRNLRPRRSLDPSFRLWRKALRRVLLLLILVCFAGGLSYVLLPHRYSGSGQMTYRIGTDVYVLTTSFSSLLLRQILSTPETPILPLRTKVPGKRPLHRLCGR